MKPPKITPDDVFDILEACAVTGERCPDNETKGLGRALIPDLARAGRIRIDISGHNYRTVTILTGPHAGKSTAPDPSGRRVWRTIDSAGSHKIKPTGPRPSVRRQPSTLPRF